MAPSRENSVKRRRICSSGPSSKPFFFMTRESKLKYESDSNRNRGSGRPE